LAPRGCSQHAPLLSCVWCGAHVCPLNTDTNSCSCSSCCAGTHPAFSLKNADLTCASLQALTVYNIRCVLQWDALHANLPVQVVSLIASERCVTAQRAVFGWPALQMAPAGASCTCPSARPRPTPPRPAGACLPTAAASTWTYGKRPRGRPLPSGGCAMPRMTTSSCFKAQADASRGIAAVSAPL